MRLRPRLTLGFTAALLPLAIAGWLTHDRLVVRLEADYEERLAAIGAGLDRELESLEERLAAELERAAGAGPVREVLAELAAGEPLGREALDRADIVARATDLDVLDILDPESRILSSAHRKARLGYPRPDAAAIAAGPGATVVVEPMDGGVTPVLEAARDVREAGARVQLIGGLALDETRRASLERRTGATRVRFSFEGAVDAEADGVEPERSRVSRTLPALDGGRLRVEASLSRDRIDQLRGDVLRVFLALGLGGLALAAAMAAVIARGVTRPVERLLEGVQAVGRGEREAGAVELEVAGELGELIDAFNGMLEDLRKAEDRLKHTERLAAWQEIARRMAHEIKNALFPIQLTMQTLVRLEKRGDPGFAEAFREGTVTILDEVGGLKHLVEEFTRFSRLPKPHLEPVAVGELAQAVVRLILGPHPQVTSALHVDPATPPALADRELLRRVLSNLVTNALEALGEGAGKVAVSVTPDATGDAPAVRIEVVDDGPGLPTELEDDLFVPYVTTKEKGTGLGLAIVHRIVTDHGGTVEARNAPAGGACLVVRLPAAVAVRDDDSLGSGA